MAAERRDIPPMSRPPLSRPAINAMIAGGVTLLSWAAVAWGLQEPGVLTATEGGPHALAIGLGLAPAIVAPMVLLLYLRSARQLGAARAGKDVLARWIVPAEEFKAFRSNNLKRNGLGAEYRNVWKPRRASGEDIEVIFVPDAVVVGRNIYPLVNTGMFRFAGVQVLPERPLAIEFGVITTSIVGQYHRVVRSRSVLRVPVARQARDDLPRVLRHFQQVDAREIVVNGDFYLRRIRIGLIGGALSFLVAAVAFSITPRSAGPDEVTRQMIGLVFIISGVIFGIAGLILAAIAWQLRQQQLPQRSRR